jgi:transposase InsO family protein
LRIAPSGYRRHAAQLRDPSRRCARAIRDERLRPEIQRVWQANMCVYGADKVWKQMNRERIAVARCTVERLMKQLGLRGVMRGKRVRTTIADAAAARPLDRVNRQFRADRPNQLWVSDFTYVSTWQGWLYVAFVIDVFARRIVGWRVSSSMTTDFVLDALEQALYARRPGGDGTLIHHSDRGSQGGFNRSLQHLLKEVSNGTTTGLGFGTDGKTNNAIAWQAKRQSDRHKESVLELYCARHGDRGCRTGMWRVATVGAKMVS